MFEDYNTLQNGDRLIALTNSGLERYLTRGKVYKIVRNQYVRDNQYIYIRNDMDVVCNYSLNLFISERKYLGGCLDGVIKAVNSIPEEIITFGDIFPVVMYQDEYGIWNSDGSFNLGRFDMFKIDYDNFLHREYLDSLKVNEYEMWF